MCGATSHQNKLSSILALVVLASSAAAWPSQCIADARVQCGAEEKAFTRCMASKAPAWFTVSAVRTCLSESGCSEQDSAAQARWAVNVCGSQSNELGRNEFDGIKFTAEELRKRDTTTTGSSETTTTAEKTTTAKEKSPPSKTSTASSSETTETTITDGTSTSTTTSTASSASSVSSSNTTLMCYTTVTYTTEGWDVVASQTNGRVSRTWNSVMLAETTKCKDGLYCSSDGCMVASNEIQGTGGLIVTILFATVGATAVGVLILLCCRDGRKDKKLRAQAEADKIAKEQLIDSRS